MFIAVSILVVFRQWSWHLGPLLLRNNDLRASSSLPILATYYLNRVLLGYPEDLLLYV
jgi:hypothetical protein